MINSIKRMSLYEDFENKAYGCKKTGEFKFQGWIAEEIKSSYIYQCLGTKYYNIIAIYILLITPFSMILALN